MRKSNRITVIFLLLVCAMILAGCTKRPKTAEAEATAAPKTTAEATAEASPSASAKASASPTAKPTATPEPKADNTNPLTGEKCVKDYSSTRPVAVMVENNRFDTMVHIPHFGVSQAAIIYEMQVEQITRCMAIFMDLDDVDVIAPVRSARSYFASAAMAYDAIYVHRGESAEGNEYASTVLQYFVDNDNIDLGDDNSYRVNDAPYYGGEHSMRTKGEMLTSTFSSSGTRMTHSTASYDYGLKFTDNAAPTGGQAASQIRVCFPGTKITNFTYDSNSKAYSCYQWNADYVDGNTNQKVYFANVLVLKTPTSIGIDNKYHSAMNTYNYEGTGTFFNGGYAEQITWKRGNLNDCFHYYDASGNELALGVGHTYICIIGNNSGYGDNSGLSFQ